MALGRLRAADLADHHAYTLVDGIGARLSGSALQYTVWLFVLSGGAMAVYGGPASARGSSAISPPTGARALGRRAVDAAYAIAIWAMTVAPIALVAALRETSVLFAALFSMALLREPVLPVRIAAACLVLAGVVLVRLR